MLRTQKNCRFCKIEGTPTNPLLNLRVIMVPDSTSNEYTQVGDLFTGTLSITNTGNVPLSNFQITNNCPDLYFTGSVSEPLAPNQTDTNVKWRYFVTQTDVTAAFVNVQSFVQGFFGGSSTTSTSTTAANPNGQSPVGLVWTTPPVQPTLTCSQYTFSETPVGSGDFTPTFNFVFNVNDTTHAMFCVQNIPANTTDAAFTFTLLGTTAAAACDLDLFLAGISNFEPSTPGTTVSESDFSNSKIQLPIPTSDWSDGTSEYNITLTVNSIVEEITSKPGYDPARGVCFVLGANTDDATCADPIVRVSDPCLMLNSKYEILEFNYADPVPNVHVEAVLEAARQYYCSVIKKPVTPMTIEGRLLYERVFVYVFFDALGTGPTDPLGTGGQFEARSTSAPPTAVGTLRINTDYISDLSRLYETGVHEIMHVFGFGDDVFALHPGLADCTFNVFTGTNAVQEYRTLTGSPQVSIPMGPGCSHWSESLFDAEILTTEAELPGMSEAVSRMTLASLTDLGYEGVDLSAADPYTIP